MYASLLLIVLTYGETFNRTQSNYQQPVACTSFPCIINCDETNSCRDTTISCGNSIGGGVCIINLKGTYSGYQSNIFTQSATDITINVDGYECFRYGYILANTVVGAKLYIDVNGPNYSFREIELYAPYGVGSELTIICGTDSTNYDCYDGRIYNDYSTKTSLYSHSIYGFEYTEVSQQLAIIKNNNPSDPLYINYRASVILYCSTGDRGFQNFKYLTRDHGNFTVEGHGKWAFLRSTLRADHTFITNEEYYITVKDTTGDETTSLGSFELYASQNNAHINIIAESAYATTHSDGDSAYFFHLIAHRSDFVLSDLTVVGTATRSLRFSQYNITSNISGNVLFEMTGKGACRDAHIFMNRIDGNLNFAGLSSAGISFYDPTIDILLGVGGNVEFSDYSITGGQGFRRNTAGSHITIGDIGGTLTVSEHSEYGNAFYNQDWIIGSIGRNVILRSYTDNGRSAFGYGTFIIECIHNGYLQMISNSYTSFRDYVFTVNNGINGDVIIIDIGSQGLGFYNSFFNFYGIITGSFSVRDQTINAGRTCESTEWIVDSVLGDMEFVETSQRGSAFLTGKFTIGYVGGNLQFRAEIDNGYQAFDQSIYTIGTVNGDLTMYSNTIGAFSDSTVNIEQINGIGTFIGNAAAGNDFYHTDFSINGSSQIIFNTIGTQAIRDSHNYFGANVGDVILNIQGGTPYALYSSIFDCRGCDSFTLNCVNDADCAGLSVATATLIYCPENNKNNKCMITCDSSAKCDYMYLFTTNGYCNDAKFECTNCTNNIANPFGNGLSRIHCTTNGDNYGTNGNSYCMMKQDALNNYQWDCDDYGGASCSINKCTDSPTLDPTNSPSNNPSKYPTINPTKTPTTRPTVSPTQFGDTKHPTSNPTKTPTKNPTISPSKYPSKYPTNNPTISPTNIPSYTPSNNPSSNPSNFPSTSPTYKPTLSPSNNPSESPIQSDGIAETTINQYEQGKGNTTLDSFGGSQNMFYIIIILGVLLFIVIVILIIVFCRRNKAINKIKKDISIQGIELGNQLQTLQKIKSVSSVGDGETTTTEIAIIPQSPSENGPQLPSENIPGSPSINNNEYENDNELKPIIAAPAQNIVPVIFDNDNALKMWLNNLNLLQYYNTFVEHGFNDQVSSLSEITDDDLKEMVFKKIGHRRE
eukprot:20139_1